jgi:hypothetical protein
MLLLQLRQQLTMLCRFWQAADTIGLCFWIICNAVQFRVFNRAELSSLNWLLNWHTLPLSLLAALQLVAVVNVSLMSIKGSQTRSTSRSMDACLHRCNSKMHCCASLAAGFVDIE